MSIVDPIRDDRGWAFTEATGTTGDLLHDWGFLSEAYDATDPDFEGRISVPVLWDRADGLDRQQRVGRRDRDAQRGVRRLRRPRRSATTTPSTLRAEMDALNERVYETVNDGVYRTGFATSQEAYEESVFPIFETLDMLDERLADRRYLFGDEQTLADWRLFTTLIRFDAVYYSHFKCNLRRIKDYPSLWPYLRDLYQTPGVAETVDFDQIKRHYYGTHKSINPNGIVPAGPILELDAPHDRG